MITSQVRMSGTVISLLPIFLTVVLWFLNPKYLMSFMDAGPYCAVIAAAVVIILISVGFTAMMKIADIEV